MRTYDLAPIQGSCPVCRSTDAERLYKVSSSDAAQHFIRQDADPARHERLRIEIERLWAGPTCQITRCKTCGFVYAFPYVAGKEAFYGNFLHAPSYPPNRFEFGCTRTALQNVHGRNTGGTAPALLEVGAGDGAFIHRVVPELFQKENVLCTEFSQSGADALRQLGVECVMTDVRGLDRPRDQHRFTAICMFQVLEHMDGLDELWESFNRLAAPNADLFLAVPNGQWIEYQEKNTGLLDMPPNHVGRWNRRAFETIGARHGWKLVDHVTEPCGRAQLWRSIAGARFFHARSVNGSLTDRTTRVSNRLLRRALSLPAFALQCVAALPTALTASPKTLGEAQWAHLHFS